MKPSQNQLAINLLNFPFLITLIWGTNWAHVGSGTYFFFKVLWLLYYTSSMHISKRDSRILTAILNILKLKWEDDTKLYKQYLHVRQNVLFSYSSAPVNRLDFVSPPYLYPEQLASATVITTYASLPEGYILFQMHMVGRSVTFIGWQDLDSTWLL